MTDQLAKSSLGEGLAEMLKGGVIMDVMNVEQAKIAEEAGAVAVMALERIPSMIRTQGGVARMSDPPNDSRYYECGNDPGDGESSYWSFCRSADPSRTWRGLHR